MRCIPSTALTAQEGEESLGIFTTPLLKCPEAESDCVFTAIASGKRSAIVKIEDDLYRLKGCGNLGEGFPIEMMPWPEGSYDVRGC